MESKKIIKDYHKNEEDIQPKPPINSLTHIASNFSQTSSQESSLINTFIIPIKSSRFHHESIKTWSDEDFYEGSIKDGLFHGYGCIKKNNHIFYRGYFHKGKFQGTGCLNLENGAKYSGEFSNNTFYGIGILTLANGESYITETSPDGRMNCKKLETSFK